MIKYPEAYNPILEYYERIKGGAEVVSRKVARVYRKLAEDIGGSVGAAGTVDHYSHSRANHVLEFAENYCRHSKGKLGGQLVVLELWEKAMLAAMFGFIDDEGRRRYREIILIVAKKNGKSLIGSIVGLYLQVGDGEPGAEVYAVATKKDQAKIIWGEAKRMVNKSPELRRIIKPLVGEMDCAANESVFKPLASDTDTLDGLNVHGALMDEVHQWRDGVALYDIIADGTTAREQPMVLITSTAGVVREDIYDRKYEYAEKVILGYDDPDAGIVDDHFLPFIYELDSREEWEIESCWKKANPGLGTIKNIRQLRDKVAKAKQEPSLQRNLLCKEFNIRETAGGSWLSFDDLNNETLFDVRELKPRYGVGGADLSSTDDLTAACVIFMLPGCSDIYVIPMFWIPENSVERHIRTDKIRYDIWIEKGWVRTCPGNKINPDVVWEWFVEIQNEYDIYLFDVGYDSWSAEMWASKMKQTFGEKTMHPVIQGKKTLSNPMKMLAKDFEAHRIIYNNNGLLKWCIANTSVDEDKNGNIQPIKNRRPTQRIDGLAALLDAYTVLQDNLDEYLSVI
ncbi:MAG: terminase large subunit [Oscillospiraceae bacterium]|nr:terminase large subunit [Oscillospiraceae bacterium]